MNTRKFMGIRKALSFIGILSILSSLVIAIPMASAYSGADAETAGLGWAKAAVDAACEKGLIDCELPDPGFKTVVNRAVGYQMLVSGFQLLSEDAAPAAPFVDVNADDWFHDAAAAAYTVGWTAGIEKDGKRYFMAADPMTRAQLAVAASSVLGLSECDASVLDSYKDKGDIPAWAKGPMACMVENKLMVGSNGMLKPNQGAIKAEVIVVLNAQVDYAEENEVDVLEVAAERLGVDADTVVEALESGQNIVDGELVAVEEPSEEEEEEEEEVAEEEEEEEEEVAEEEEEEEVPVLPPAGSLAVSVAADTPASRNVNPGANGVPLASFQFAVTEGSASVDTVVFKRTGGGASTDFSAITLYQGAKRLKSGKTISADTNTVEFSGIALTATPEAPVVLMLKGDVTTTAGLASTHSFVIEAASSVTTNAGAVTGVPVTSNVVTVGGATVGTVTVATVNTLSKPTLGAKGVEVANFKLTAGANDVKFYGIALTHGGTVARSNLANFKLTDSSDSTKVLATAEALGGDLATFTLAEAYTVPKNNNRSFRIWADVIGGKTTDTLDFYLDEASDLNAQDATVGFGARVTNNLTKALVTDTTFQGGKITLADNGPIAQNVAINSTNVHLFDFALTSDRNVTVKDYYLWLEQSAFDNTSAQKSGDGNAATSTTNQAGDLDGGNIATTGVVTFQTDTLNDSDIVVNDVLKFTIPTVTTGTAGTFYVKVTALGADTTANNSTGTLVYPASVATAVTWVDGGSTYGTANTNDYEEVFDVYLASRVKNIKLIDRDTQGTIASATASSYNNVFSDDFDLVTGKTKNMAVVVDLDSTLPAANTFKGGVDFAESSFIKDLDANEFIATSDVVGGNTFGKTMTAVASSLTASRASTPVSETHVKGQGGVQVVGFSVKAGDGGSVRVSKVTFRLVADDDGNFNTGGVNGYGDLAANTVVESVELHKVNADNTTTKIAGPVGLSLVGTIGADGGYYKAEFSSLNYTVEKAITEKWVAIAKLKNTMSSTTYLGIDMLAGTDIEAQDKDGNTVTPLPATGVNNLGTGTPTVLKTIATSGTLIGSQEGSPDAAIVVAGTTGVKVAKYKYTATNESFTVKKLDVVIDSDASPGDFTDDQSADTGNNNITRISLSYLKKDGTTEVATSNLASGIASFTNLNLYVEKDRSAIVDVIADFNTIDGGATSGGTVRLGLNERALANNAFEAIGEGSSETLTAVAPGIVTYSNSTGVNTMRVRKTVPTVAKLATAATKLNNGQNDIAAITVAADAKEAVALKRIAFEFSSSNVGVTALEVYRKQGTGSESSLTSQVSIRNRGGFNLKTNASTLATGALAVDGATASDTVYVTWDKSATDQEFVSRGVTHTYIVKGSVSGAATGESLSTYVADDSTLLTTPAVVGVLNTNGVGGLRTNIAANPEVADASVSGTRTIWRWQANSTGSCPVMTAANASGCAFMDVGGDGAYTAANDPMYLIITNGAGASTQTSTLTDGGIIPGVLRYSTTSLLAEADAHDRGIYWDLATSGAYAAADDIFLGILKSTGADVTNNAPVVNDFRYTTTGSSSLYIDAENSGASANTYNAAHDHRLASLNVAVDLFVDPGTAPAVDTTELFTSNANFIWSDNSNNAHTTSTTDWTNGVDVPSLPTQTVSLSF